MLIISQEHWTGSDPEASLGSTIVAAKALAKRNVVHEFDGLLLVVPPAESGERQPLKPDLLTNLEQAASAHKVWLAGSATVREEPEGLARTIGFLVSPEAGALIATNKITPDFTTGFSDTTSDLGLPADFPVAETPWGKVGVLCGEDILIAQHARSMAWNGAELIVNPFVEMGFDGLQARQMSRVGRAAENNCFVASASPLTRELDGVRVRLPAASAFFHAKEGVEPVQGDQAFIVADYDLEEIRRRRANPGSSFAAILRADVFAATYSDEPPLAQDAIPHDRAGWIAEARRRLTEREAKFGPDKELAMNQYGAVLLQQCPRLVKLREGDPEPREIMHANLEAALELAGTRVAMPSMKLVVMPEFWLTGPGGIGGIQRTPAHFESMALTWPDPIFDRISEFAQKNSVYVAFMAFEIDPHFPQHIFNTAFLINDSGDLVHKYRKIQDADVWGLFPSTTPGSVLDRYLDKFGPEGLFPMARTPIGNLANMICFDVMHPEVARGLAKAGAEVILHSSSEIHGANLRQAWDNARRIRASENTAIVLSAIDGGEYEEFDSEVMTFFRRGHTRAVNYDGMLMGTCDGPGPVAWRVELDMAALRRARLNPMNQIALWDDSSVYVQHYRADVGMPSNLWAGDPMDNPYVGAKQVLARIKDYRERGIITPPSAHWREIDESIPDNM